jgi:hypothetical protein
VARGGQHKPPTACCGHQWRFKAVLVNKRMLSQLHTFFAIVTWKMMNDELERMWKEAVMVF